MALIVPGESAGLLALAPHAVRCFSAIAAAATQIELALHEAHEPVEDLGLLIGQISSTLGELRDARSRVPADDDDAAPRDEVRISLLCPNHGISASTVQITIASSQHAFTVAIITTILAAGGGAARGQGGGSGAAGTP